MAELAANHRHCAWQGHANLKTNGALAKNNRKAFIGAMHVAAAKAAPEVVAAINPGKARRLLDVGGGSGTYPLAMLRATPEMKATLFDLPPVIQMARDRFKNHDMLDRVELVAGDFYKDKLPTGHDLAFLSAIIHQNSNEETERLYAKIYRALDSGGRLVVRDHVMSIAQVIPLMKTTFAPTSQSARR